MAVIRTERGHGLAFGIRCVSRVKKDTVGVRCSCNNGMGCRANIASPKGKKGAKMTEEVREALMRLTMCAREECDMCKYKEKCGFEFQYNISTENMNTLLDALSADAVQGEECDHCVYKWGMKGGDSE